MELYIDYYAVLGITQNATPAEINAAFKKQSLKWHPDRKQGIEAHKKMQEINEARRILLDKVLRRKFDLEFNRQKENTLTKKTKPTQNEERTANEKPIKNNYSCNLRTDEDLICICAKAVKYKLEFINSVLMELYKRNYTHKSILERIEKNKLQRKT